MAKMAKLVYTKRAKRRAWIKKYIFHIVSPSATTRGLKYEWDLIKAYEEEAKHG